MVLLLQGFSDKVFLKDLQYFLRVLLTILTLIMCFNLYCCRLETLKALGSDILSINSEIKHYVSGTGRSYQSGAEKRRKKIAEQAVISSVAKLTTFFTTSLASSAQSTQEGPNILEVGVGQLATVSVPEDIEG